MSEAQCLQYREMTAVQEAIELCRTIRLMQCVLQNSNYDTSRFSEHQLEVAAQQIIELIDETE
jgi:hypothetical protein